MTDNAIGSNSTIKNLRPFFEIDCFRNFFSNILKFLKICQLDIIKVDPKKRLKKGLL